MGGHLSQKKMTWVAIFLVVLSLLAQTEESLGCLATSTAPTSTASPKLKRNEPSAQQQQQQQQKQQQQQLQQHQQQQQQIGSSPATATISDTKFQVLSTTVVSPINFLAPKSNLTLNSTGTATVTVTGTGGNSTDEGNRPKRQLFREDIPHHRPLSGNTYALQYGFPHPGRFTEHNSGGQSPNNQILNNNLNFESPQQYDHPDFEQPHVIQTHSVGGDVTVINHGSPDHIPGGHEQGHQGHGGEGHGGQEIVHQYPVEVSQVIQLDHENDGGHQDPGQNLYHHVSGGGAAPIPPGNHPHAPPQIHPNQNPVRHPQEHQTKPDQPPDLVVKEPNGEPGPIPIEGSNGGGGEYGAGHGEEYGAGHGGNLDGHEHQHGLYNNEGIPYAQGFGYTQQHPSRPGPGYAYAQKAPLVFTAYKFAHFLKTWPQLLLGKVYGYGQSHGHSNSHSHAHSYSSGAGAAGAVLGSSHHAHGHSSQYQHLHQHHHHMGSPFPIWPLFRRYRTKIKHNHYHHF